MESDALLRATTARRMQKYVRTALLVLSTVGILAVMAGMEAFTVSESTIDYQHALEHSTEQRAQIRRVASMLQEAETSQRGYLLTGDRVYLEQFERIRETLREPLSGLLDAMSEDPAQLSRAVALSDRATTRMRQLLEVLEESSAAGQAPADPSGAVIPRDRADAALRTRVQIQALLTEMIAFEDREIRNASRSLAERIRFSRMVTIALLVGIALLVTFVVGLGLAYLAHSRRIESELHDAMAAARQANETKTQFLASMSHEIRTPLTSILGYTELLLEEPITAHQRRFVEHLQMAGLGLSSLVDDILEFSKIEAGEIAVAEEPMSLGTLLANVLSIVSLSAEKKRVELRSELDPALPGTVLGDEARLRQVLLNLLTNAIKFTREGTVTVRIVHCGTSPDGELVRFEVADTGIGIAADRQNRLFRRFSQADPSIQHEYGGTGLGLAISKKHVTLMGGTIGFESEVGRGSTFWFRLALPRTEATTEPHTSEHVTAPARRGRILLAEDSLQNQDLVCAILRGQGHHVDVASDGQQAITAARESTYDLVLMDIGMPHIDGLTAARQIRGMHGAMRRVPIIALTANVLGQQVKAFHEAGIDDHITKPFTRPHLVAKVASWLYPAAGCKPEAKPVPDARTSPRAQALEALRELMGDAWLRASLARLRDRIDTTLAACAASPDREQVKRHAHQLVSDAGQLGFSELSGACAALEDACASGAALEPALDRTRRAARQTKSTLDQLLTRLRHG